MTNSPIMPKQTPLSQAAKLLRPGKCYLFHPPRLLTCHKGCPRHRCMVRMRQSDRSCCGSGVPVPRRCPSIFQSTRSPDPSPFRSLDSRAIFPVPTSRAWFEVYIFLCALLLLLLVLAAPCEIALQSLGKAVMLTVERGRVAQPPSSRLSHRFAGSLYPVGSDSPYYRKDGESENNKDGDRNADDTGETAGVVGGRTSVDMRSCGGVYHLDGIIFSDKVS
jgi:hypothetical protein